MYLLESVDNALRLLQMLRDVGAVRLKQAAAEPLENREADPSGVVGAGTPGKDRCGTATAGGV